MRASHSAGARPRRILQCNSAGPCRCHFAHGRSDARGHRDHNAQVGSRDQHPRERFAENGPERGNLADPRPGQHREHVAIAAEGGAVPRDLLRRGLRRTRDRVAHEVTAHPRRLHQRRLHRQKRQHMIHVPRHLPRAPRSPRPDRWGDIVDHWQIEPRGFHARRNPQAEVGRVDCHERIEVSFLHRLCRFVTTMQEAVQPRQNFREPHHAELGHRKERVETLLLHCRPPYPLEGDVRYLEAKRRHKVRAEIVPRRLPRDQKKPHRGRPQMKSPAASAAATVSSRPASMTPPASSTRPARPALMARLTVSGPTTGRSSRRSCPALGAFM